MTLLSGRLEPITLEFGFVQVPCAALAEWWLAWDSGIQRKRGGQVSRRTVAGGLGTSLMSLLPLTSVERRRVLLVPTRSDWTAVFDNGWRGGDAAVLAYPASELRCHATRVVAVPEVRVGRTCRRSGARVFELYGPDRTIEGHNCVRAIAVVNDGGRWQTILSGRPLFGEDAAWFEARLAKDRFRDEHLATLLASLGIAAFDPNFYGEGAVLLERHGPTAVGLREVDLLEAQAAWR